VRAAKESRNMENFRANIFLITEGFLALNYFGHQSNPSFYMEELLAASQCKSQVRNFIVCFVKIELRVPNVKLQLWNIEI
jgi:hypothetical protein